MIDARVKINEYSNRVFGVVKAKYGLKDKSEAINKFAEMYGDNEIEPEIKREYLRKLNKIEKEHMKKYGFKSMTKKEFDNLFK